MHFKSGERTFIVDANSYYTASKNDYLDVMDKDTHTHLILPKHVVLNFKYMFSWDRYREDLNRKKVFITLKAEQNRLERMPQSASILKGIEDMKMFINTLN